MKTTVYAILDKKAGFYGVPFFMHNEALAVRAFVDLQKDENSTISKNPEDFSLYTLGEYDDNSGKVEALPEPKFVTNAIVA